MFIKKQPFSFTVLLATFLSISPLTASAVFAGENKELQRAQVSRQLFDAGLGDRDPLLIIAAAKLRKSTGLEETDRKPKSSDTDATTTTDGTALTWQSMLNVARDLSVGDDLMLGLIGDIEAESTKGVVNGPVYNIAKITAKHTDTYDAVPFEAQKYAEIYIEGQGNSDLNLYVYDIKSRLVCSDTDTSDIAYCGWRPQASSGFSIKVTNKGNVATQYSLMTN